MCALVVHIGKILLINIPVDNLGPHLMQTILDDQVTYSIWGARWPGG